MTMIEGRGSRPVAMPEAPGADLMISEVYAEGLTEHVTIENQGQIDQPLTGWALASLHGLTVFEFPAGTVIAPGGRLRVLSGESAPATSGGDLLWTRENVWSNRADTALLFDNLGHEVTRFTYPRPTIRGERKPKLKVLVREIDGYHLYDGDDVVPPGRD
jgi:hypothetical protein